MNTQETDTGVKGFAKHFAAMTLVPIAGIIGLGISMYAASPSASVKEWANTEKRPVTKAGTAARLAVTSLWAVSLMHNAEKGHTGEEIFDLGAVALSATGLVASRVNAHRGTLESDVRLLATSETKQPDPASVALNPNEQVTIHKPEA